MVGSRELSYQDASHEYKKNTIVALFAYDCEAFVQIRILNNCCYFQNRY